jgi:predicted nucleotidyltransferase
VATTDRVFDAQEILRVLAAYRVDFVVIGGIAVQAHGYIRWTKDLDVIVKPTALNFSRLSEALRELEAELRGSGTLKLTDPHQLRRAPLIPVMTTAGPLDVVSVQHVAGPPRSYDGLRQAALVVELSGSEVAVAGLSDLIRMKRAAGREHDLADIEALTRRADDRPDGGGEST